MATVLQIAPYLGHIRWQNEANLFSVDSNPLPVFSKDIATLSTSTAAVNEVRRGGSGILFTYSGTTYVIDETTALRYFLGDRAKYKWRVIDDSTSQILTGPFTFRFYRSTASTIEGAPNQVRVRGDIRAPIDYGLVDLIKAESSTPWKRR